MQEMINDIRGMMSSIGDGEINISPYDTAWVALVKKMGGDESPQFPSCISWIIENQLSDGSWGDEGFYLIQDRMINTLSCVIALKSWNLHMDKSERGLSFIRDNMWRIEDNKVDDWMLAGFEITFPQLLQMANELGLDLPYDEPALQDVYAKRNLKLSRIPKDMLHNVPTTLLFSIEGMRDLDWNRLLKLQCSDGSIVSSAAPTAYALMQTGDKKCLEFLSGLVNKFDMGVPYIYPVDLFERLWVVDRLERLGISRYFTSEIKECMEYVYRQWNQEGLPATRDNPVKDSDDTAMGFRLLRLHGYHVTPGVFQHFEKDGEFYCYRGESNKSVTSMFSLYRASQVAFPGEDELQRAEIYCHEFLHDRLASHKLKDKWVIPKDLPGEVRYALDFPWKASLPRIETMMYLEQYGGSADVWIGKVLYRMHLVNNDLLLEAAKADFRNFQRLCQLEWHGIKKWYNKRKLETYGVSPKRVLQAYFLAAACIFEPNRATERLGWARTSVLAEAISSHFRCTACADSTRESFIAELTRTSRNNIERGEEKSQTSSLLQDVDELISLLSIDRASSDNLCEVWKQWLKAWNNDNCEGNTALLLVRTIEICSGRHHNPTEQEMNLFEYSQLEHLTFSICHKLGLRTIAQEGEHMENIDNSNYHVNLEMKELARCVLHGCSAINEVTRQTFLHVVKSFNYTAHCSPEIVDSHISKVIFECIT
ncbi:unnamed protein product [Urochloa humidicola]